MQFRRRHASAALALSGVLAIVGLPLGYAAPEPRNVGSQERVGRGPNGIVTPVNQRLTPVGRVIELAGLRPQVLVLSPNGRLLVTSGKSSELVVLDPVSGVIRQRVVLPNEKQESLPDVVSPNILKPDKEGLVSFTGLAFSPDGRRLFLSNVNGSIKVFQINPDDTVVAAYSLVLPEAKAPRRKAEIPAGLQVSSDGLRLYVCGNLSNQLLELDSTTGQMIRSWPVGVAPYDVVLVKNRAYVSNWGGRRPGTGDLTGPAGRGTEVRVDPIHFTANEGSVTAIDLTEKGKGHPPTTEILCGLHASALAVSPNGRWVVCANAAADTLSVIDTRTDRVMETIWTRVNASDLLGASPNALAFAPDGRTLYVANGTQNAVGVIHFEPEDRESKLVGLIPVGWFPAALVYDARRRQLEVANLKGLPQRPQKSSAGEMGYNSHHYSGSISFVPLPTKRDLLALSETVARNLRREAIAQSRLPARPGQPARAIPERIGEPSLIRHVIYIIKENRTYDQVLGDEPRGNGAPQLCVFGKQITPNQHQLVRDFVLLDNTYCSGILSADGHQWSSTAFSTDYMEKSFAGFPRSYPDGMGEDEADALAYAPTGFLWDNALSHQRTVRNYGEFAAPAVHWRDPKRKGSPGFLACYRTWKGQNGDVIFESYPMVASLKGIQPTAYVGWEMAVPDQFRADFFLRELKEFDAHGEFPQLTLICLPNDHTSGTSKDCPTPAACVADNDLALGRILEGLSHSRFWPETAVFVIEDDPQAGWDHVSGYRTTAYCVSPYAKRGAVVSTQYNTTCIIRTLEQILGLPPMNQFDASATPLWDCFTEVPDLKPFVALPSNVPLDQMNPGSEAITDPILRRDAEISGKMNFREADKAPEDVLNRILWRAMRGSTEPYPEWAITPGADADDK